MPFTAAHPAIILPFCRSKKVSATALIAGSMVPDFEFFFHMREVENIGHHLPGIFLFDLPAGLALCFVFHLLVRNPLIAHLPGFLQMRFTQVTTFNWIAHFRCHYLRVLVSLLAGICPHLIWDAFTHYDGWVVSFIPSLRQVISAGPFSFAGYFWLQLISSAAGLAAVAIFIRNLPVLTPVATPSVLRVFWPAFLLVYASLISVRIISWPQYNSFWGIVMAVLGGFLYTLLALSLVYRLKQLKITSI